MTFPLKEWIDQHSDCRYNLGRSGMPVRLPGVDAALRRPEEPDEGALRRELAGLHGVAPARLFLTHGATEANTLTLFFLARELRRSTGRLPRCAIPVPEYPPIRTTAELAPFRIVRVGQPADAVVGSWPNNPTGALPEDPRGRSGRRVPLVADETFREFTEAPSFAADGTPNAWVAGSFTKIYGADELRVGFVLAPEEQAEAFGRFHGVLLDELPKTSVAGARALLRERPGILREVRARFRTNLEALRRALPECPVPAAPVCFDRPQAPRATDSLAEAALSASILVCPGRLFGDPTGVRLCLTQPTFPDDLEAYLRVRARWIRPSRTRS